MLIYGKIKCDVSMSALRRSVRLQQALIVYPSCVLNARQFGDARPADARRKVALDSLWPLFDALAEHPMQDSRVRQQLEQFGRLPEFADRANAALSAHAGKNPPLLGDDSAIMDVYLLARACQNWAPKTYDASDDERHAAIIRFKQSIYDLLKAYLGTPENASQLVVMNALDRLFRHPPFPSGECKKDEFGDKMRRVPQFAARCILSAFVNSERAEVVGNYPALLLWAPSSGDMARFEASIRTKSDEELWELANNAQGRRDLDTLRLFLPIFKANLHHGYDMNSLRTVIRRE